MSDAEAGTCRSCGGDLVRTQDRTYHPWDVTGHCPERMIQLGHEMADVHPDAFVPLRENVRDE